jgi:PhnB protein
MERRLHVQLSVHLCFDGTCEEAFRFYHEVLGGSIKTMLKYGDAPGAANVSEQMQGRILHATLDLGDCELLGVDLMPSQARAMAGFFVTLSESSIERARQIFSALSEGGNVQMPFEKTFWSAGFGVLTDRFGVPWEISVE